MGRPINKKYLGDPAHTGKQVKMTEAWIPGESAKSSKICYVVKQKGTGRYLIQEKGVGGKSGVVRLVGPGKPIGPGEARLRVQPFGSPLPPAEYARVIHNHTVNTWSGKRYIWSIKSANVVGQADLDMA